MVYQILISTMYLHFFNFFIVFMIVGLVGEAVVIAEDFRLLIPPLLLSPDNTWYSPHRSRDETGLVTNRGIWWAKKKWSRLGL